MITKKQKPLFFLYFQFIQQPGNKKNIFHGNIKTESLFLKIFVKKIYLSYLFFQPQKINFLFFMELPRTANQNRKNIYSYTKTEIFKTSFMYLSGKNLVSQKYRPVFIFSVFNYLFYHFQQNFQRIFFHQNFLRQNFLKKSSEEISGINGVKYFAIFLLYKVFTFF